MIAIPKRFSFLACLVALAVAASTFGNAWAGPIEDADIAHLRRDYPTALRLYRVLADQEDARAQFNLGLMHRNGQGVQQDFAEAMKWYRRAAEQGYAPALANIGFLYEHGRGVTQNLAVAIEWYRLAAERGDPTAQYNLGVAYAQGRGVAKDLVEAHKWFGLSAAKGDKDAANASAQIAKLLTPEQLVQAERRTYEWTPKSWDQLKHLLPKQ